jgi:2-phosphosulfolactate phosphatase
VNIEVAFVPVLLTDASTKVCLVIDVLRASSTIVTMLDRGASEVLVCPTVEDARRLARAQPGRYLLCGEVNGLPPEGFDYGNSPSEFSTLDLSGRRLILATTNGTAALAAAADAPAVLVGSLLNLSAAAEAALREARSRGLDIAIVCAGRDHGRYFGMEDSFCAGALVERILAVSSDRPHLWNDALAARRLYRSYRRSPLAALNQADHSRSLLDIGLGHDVEFCAQIDISRRTPRLYRDRDGRLVLRAP